MTNKQQARFCFFIGVAYLILGFGWLYLAKRDESAA